MPYLTQHARVEIDEGRYPATNGELNFLLTQCCLDYVKTNGERYTTYNDIIGALEGAKLEMYRRAVAPYEDKKIKENGDVYV